MASELVSVKFVASTDNAIFEVQQGATVNFEIHLTATGAEMCTATPLNPDQARVDTVYQVVGTTGHMS